MASREYVALTLASSEYESVLKVQDISTGRKSLKRIWNRLPRCQRNLIVFAVVAVCMTAFLFISDGQHGFQNMKAGQNRELQGDTSYGITRESVQKAGETLHIDDQYEISNPPMAYKEVVVDSGTSYNETQLNKIGGYASYRLASNGGNMNNYIEVPFVDELIKSAATDNRDMDAIITALKDVLCVSGVSIEDHVNKKKAGKVLRQHFHGASNARQSAVVAAFQHSWEGYKKYAWGHDNLKPISKSPSDWFYMGLTIVDSLDTLYIMGLEEEFAFARDWVAKSLSLDRNGDVNLFEVTIRVLGGLLSAYHLSGDTIFLEKSIELGNRLLPSFQSPSGIPYSDVNLQSLTGHSPKWSPDSSTSEVATIQLEFRDLSRSSHIPLYERLAYNVNIKIHELEKPYGLVPIFINANTGKFRESSTITIGARGDSYYEYLLKQWLQLGRTKHHPLIEDYKSAIEGIRTHLLKRTPNDNFAYIGELRSGKIFEPKMDHLVCYLPGTLLLGFYNGMPRSHHTLAFELFDTCQKTYTKQPTGLAPEISHFAVSKNEGDDIYVKPADTHNLLRPEFIESLYYFYVLTGNRTYQDIGWQIFEAFNHYAKVGGGYTSIGDVRNTHDPKYRDNLESFWFSETLKYLYLLFSDNRKEIDLEMWIFNSEGHPLPIKHK